MTSETTRYRTTQEPAEGTGLKIGAACTIVGALAFGTLRVLHGDTPGDDPDASLTFVAGRPAYAGIHIGAVLAAVLSLAGPIALVGSLTHPTARLLGRLGLAASLIGLGIFGVESTSEGLALPELASTAAHASPDQRADLVRAAHAVLAVTHGPSLVAVALLYGVAAVALGLAITFDDYPSWLGWSGLAVGAATLVAATGQYLHPDLIPGFLIYGLLASILAQAWLIALAVAMIRHASTMRPARTP
jgi:Domain of unknown function (DUF4386)